MNASDCFRLIVEQIHNTVVATVDEDGLPVTCALDMMDWDGDGLYFLTARGKGLYRRLCARPFIALTAMEGRDTLSSIAVSLRGQVEELGQGPLPSLLGKNAYMYSINPDEESRKTLTVFRISSGSGELFDLSRRPVERRGFSFGRAGFAGEVYMVSARCTGCGTCLSVCPQTCIDSSTVPFRIEPEHCLHCGCCLEVCPAAAVERRRI